MAKLTTASARAQFTLRVAEQIRRTGYRFDKTWRHGETAWKQRFYERCCTFAANDIADHPEKADFWIEFL